MSPEFDAISARTAPMPRILWIELSSRCPFDCVFCTRASLRGAGEQMDFAIYQRLIAELERPQIIRLNYAGESGHYPHLSQAVALAAATGAEVELVSALASLKPERLQAALDAGLTRLTVSLHTLDHTQFDAIYRFSSLDAMRKRLQQALDWRACAGPRFALDLAFVAMRRNLDQLPAVAQFAAENGIEVLAVHPLIGRDALPMGASGEHNELGQLSRAFRADLAQSVAAVRARWPQLTLQLSSHELAQPRALDAHPQPWPLALPQGAMISNCDQSPFDSVHVLADGRVIVCEVTEKLSIGDLRQSSLREIWHGAAYRQFRQRHRAGTEAACRDCIYKSAHRPTSATSRVVAATAPADQLLDGWHSDDGSGVRWAAGEAALWLPRERAHRRLRLRGMIPPAAAATPFSVHIDGQLAHRQTGSGTVELALALAASARSYCLVRIERSGACSPHSLGSGNDVRELGFALIAAELE